MSQWIRPICDHVLFKIRLWEREWERGEVAATRPFLHKTGQVEDMVTMRATKIAWNPKEFEHLVRILKEVRPDWSLTVDFDEFYRTIFPRARMLPGGLRVAEMAIHREYLKELIEVLDQVRTGRQSAVKEIEEGTFWGNL